MDTTSDTDTARDEMSRLLFDAVPLPAWICDAETLVLREVNACDLTGSYVPAKQRPKPARIVRLPKRTEE